MENESCSFVSQCCSQHRGKAQRSCAGRAPGWDSEKPPPSGWLVWHLASAWAHQQINNTDLPPPAEPRFETPSCPSARRHAEAALLQALFFFETSHRVGIASLYFFFLCCYFRRAVICPIVVLSCSPTRTHSSIPAPFPRLLLPLPALRMRVLQPQLTGAR